MGIQLSDSPFPTVFSKSLLVLMCQNEYIWSKGLTLSQTTKFRLVQTERIFSHSRRFSKLLENTVGKGDIARFEQILPFPQCFQKTCTAGT